MKKNKHTLRELYGCLHNITIALDPMPVPTVEMMVPTMVRALHRRAGDGQMAFDPMGVGDVHVVMLPMVVGVVPAAASDLRKHDLILPPPLTFYGDRVRRRR